MARIDHVGFMQRYDDDSGVQFGVYYDRAKSDREIKIEHIESAVEIPKEKLPWLIECLEKIRGIDDEE